MTRTSGAGEREWLIRDGHTGLYWRDDACGYGRLIDAGLYTEAQARRQESLSRADRKDKAVHVSEVREQLERARRLVNALDRSDLMKAYGSVEPPPLAKFGVD